MSDSIAKRPKVTHENERVYLRFGASLRILGDRLDFDEISRTLGLSWTHAHRKGDRRSPRSQPWPNDMWVYQPPVDGKRPLDEHILAVWDAVRPNIGYLRELKRKVRIDVLCVCRSNTSAASFKIDPRCLGLFVDLDVPFEISVLID
jgi:hypothetical protein